MKALQTRALKGGNLLYEPSGDAATIHELLAASPDPLIQLLWHVEQLLKPPYKLFLPPEE